MEKVINGKTYELVENKSDMYACSMCAFIGTVSSKCAIPANDYEDECWRPENENKHWKEVKNEKG